MEGGKKDKLRRLGATLAADVPLALKMESDTTVRRIKPPFGTQSYVAPGHGSPGDSYGEDYNGWSGGGVSEPKRKPDVSLYLLREGLATSLVCVFILLLWALVHLSLQQLVIGKPSGEFNAERAR